MPGSYGPDTIPVAIPQNLPSDKVIFSTTHFVSNGKVPDITHIVYVDLEGYSQLGDPAAMRDVGRAVGRLNKLLPKRQFILVGPGRWGSRGDIRLRGALTYSEINNTAMLIEVARQKGKLSARAFVWDPFLPGPGRSFDPLPSSLPRRCDDSV